MKIIQELRYYLPLQIEGAFVQGIGFFMLEEYLANSDGLVTSDGTWTYKIPTMDTVPKQLNVEILNSGPHKNRVLSSKGAYHSLHNSTTPLSCMLFLLSISMQDACSHLHLMNFVLMFQTHDLPLKKGTTLHCIHVHKIHSQ